MLHRDYLLEVIEQFVNGISQSLVRVFVDRDLDAGQDVEAAVSELVQLDPDTAMSLAPESLVTMMILSGTGDAVAGYAAFALNRLGEAYERIGEHDLAEARKAQAQAIADSFGASLDEIPEELRELNAQLQ
jgi:hypothetical protein